MKRILTGFTALMFVAGTTSALDSRLGSRSDSQLSAITFEATTPAGEKSIHTAVVPRDTAQSLYGNGNENTTIKVTGTQNLMHNRAGAAIDGGVDSKLGAPNAAEVNK